MALYWFTLCLAVSAATAYYDYDYDHFYDNDNYGYYGASAFKEGPAEDYYGDYYDYEPRRPAWNTARPKNVDIYGRPVYSRRMAGGKSGHSHHVHKPIHHPIHHPIHKPIHKPRIPVIIKKKAAKKTKTIQVNYGMYIPGGTSIFGKFRDLKSCQKACDLTPTCFSGDFNPHNGKCYMHSNLTACQQLKAHPSITHFKKAPCTVFETPRGLITLGAASYYGLEQKKIDSLLECIKKCATAGGGVAPMPSTAGTAPQLCFGIDYNFATHKCFFHSNIKICNGVGDTNAIPLTPVTQRADPSSVNILICPKSPETG